MTTRSNPELREAAEALLKHMGHVRTALGVRVHDVDEDDILALRAALTASASGGEDAQTITLMTGQPWRHLKTDPSAPTYNVSRLEFDQLKAKADVLEGRLAEVIAACRRNGVWVD